MAKQRNGTHASNQGKHYDPAQKASIISRLLQNESVTAISRQTGITDKTLYNWKAAAKRDPNAVVPLSTNDAALNIGATQNAEGAQTPQQDQQTQQTQQTQRTQQAARSDNQVAITVLRQRLGQAQAQCQMLEATINFLKNQ